MKIADIVKGPGIAEVVRQFQLGRELDPVAVSQLRKSRLILFVIFLVSFGLFRKQGGTDSYRLGEHKITRLNGFGFQIKSLPRLRTGTQRSVIGDVADDFNFFALKKLLGRLRDAGLGRPQPPERSRANQRQHHGCISQADMVL